MFYLIKSETAAILNDTKLNADNILCKDENIEKVLDAFHEFGSNYKLIITPFVDVDTKQFGALSYYKDNGKWNFLFVVETEVDLNV